MAIETILYVALSGDSDITDIVGDRIYSDIREQGDIIPSIYFDRSDTEYTYTIGSNIPAIEKATFFVTCFASTREASENINDEVVAALSASGFICYGKESGYEEETEDYSTTIQASYLQIN